MYFRPNVVRPSVLKLSSSPTPRQVAELGPSDTNYKSYQYTPIIAIPTLKRQKITVFTLCSRASSAIVAALHTVLVLSSMLLSPFSTNQSSILTDLLDVMEINARKNVGASVSLEIRFFSFSSLPAIKL